MKTLAIGLALAAAVPGCHAVNRWAFGDPSIHNHVSLLTGEDGKKNHFVGSISRSELAAGSSAWEESFFVSGTKVKASAPEQAGQICFRFAKYGYDGIHDTKEEFTKGVEEAMRTLQFEIAAHDSLADYPEGKAWPTTGTVKVEDIHVQDVTYNKSKVHGYYEDGTPKKNIPTYDAVFEVCGAAPAMSETTKYLSFAVLTGSEKENRIALWEVRP
jgi:hypothetical protein